LLIERVGGTGRGGFSRLKLVSPWAILIECNQNCQLHSQKDFILLSPERALHTSPGQRPGKMIAKFFSPERALHKHQAKSNM